MDGFDSLWEGVVRLYLFSVDQSHVLEVVSFIYHMFEILDFQKNHFTGLFFYF
jgi:hypothetical protein